MLLNKHKLLYLYSSFESTGNKKINKKERINITTYNKYYATYSKYILHIINVTYINITCNKIINSQQRTELFMLGVK